MSQIIHSVYKYLHTCQRNGNGGLARWGFWATYFFGRKSAVQLYAMQCNFCFSQRSFYFQQCCFISGSAVVILCSAFMFVWCGFPTGNCTIGRNCTAGNRKTALLDIKTALLEIKTALLDIKTALLHIQTALLHIQTALLAGNTNSAAGSEHITAGIKSHENLLHTKPADMW